MCEGALTRALRGHAGRQLLPTTTDYPILLWRTHYGVHMP